MEEIMSLLLDHKEPCLHQMERTRHHLHGWTLTCFSERLGLWVVPLGKKVCFTCGKKCVGIFGDYRVWHKQRWLVSIKICPSLFWACRWFYFPASLRPRCGLVTKLSPLKFDWKWCPSLPGLAHKTFHSGFSTLLLISLVGCRQLWDLKGWQCHKMQRTWVPKWLNGGKQPHWLEYMFRNIN